MKRDSFLVLAAIVAAVFGLAFLIAPAQLTALYGVTLTPATEVLGRIAGSTIFCVRHRLLGRPPRRRGGSLEGGDGGRSGRQRPRLSDPGSRGVDRPR